MLTKEQIELFPERIHLPIPTGSCRSRQLKDQAIVAIDLAAENEQLKAKLDAVRELADPVNLWGKDLLHELAVILDKDGDET